MEQPSYTFRQLQILHGAMMVGVVFMSVVIAVLMVNNGTPTDYTGIFKGFLLFAACILAFQIGVSFVVWNWKQSRIPTSNDHKAKWAHYQTSCILRWALIEGGTLISMVLTYLEGNTAGFILVAVGLAFLFLARPDRAYLLEKYGLNN